MSSTFQKTLIAAGVLSLFSTPTLAESQLPTVVVNANGIEYVDADAAYASEVHDRERIKSSGASNLVDYLAQNTTLTVKPNFGNRFSPAIDMRGYGISNGFQSISVSVDGRRINEIDMVPPLLGAIPLDSIDRIEITKGSGSVAFGDGATAGSIQIYTRAPNGVNLSASVGSHGFSSLDVSAGLQQSWGEISASSSSDNIDGYSRPDVTGHKDTSSSRTDRARLLVKPSNDIKLIAEGSTSTIDTRYPGPLTQAQYMQNPAQNGGNTYTHQSYGVDQWKLSGEISLGNGWQTIVSHNEENKTSRFLGVFPFSAGYDYTSDEVLLRRKGQTFDLSSGWQRFEGARKSTTDITRKNNEGLFAQAAYHMGALLLSAGLRQDRVDYAYSPVVGAALSRSQNLSAWDIGANYRVDDQTTVFANLNSAFQAPDIDRFFNFGGTFNAFIVPAKSRTANVGFSRDDSSNRLRATVFYSRLKNEIYFEPISFTNTNLDRTHKYGLELQDTWQATDKLRLSGQYTYTRAIIDHTSQGAGAYDGKELPGVPRHGVNLGLAYQWNQDYSVNLDHVWRDSSYSINDFANNLTQRQAAYQTTNASLHYRHQGWEASATIANLFDKKNGLWLQDNVIYPVDFTRSFKLGLKKTF